MWITFIFEKKLYSGAEVIFTGETRLPYGQVPLLLHNGEVTLQTSSGKIANLLLDTHTFEERIEELAPEKVL